LIKKTRRYRKVPEDLFEKIVELAKRRGYFWPSYEIYGGVAGFYDLGPLGTMLKNNIIDLWRKFFIKEHQEYVVEIETPIIGPGKVYEASGHLESFTDPIVECMKCGRKFRADHLIESVLGKNVEGLPPEELTKIIKENNIRCPVCGGPLSEVKTFNLLFKTQIGPYEGSIGFLRPELAQGMFVSFKRTLEVMRNKLPLGIAQIGKVGRNEISPRQGIIRLREFTIAEMEYFFDPEDEIGSCPNYDNIKDLKVRLLTCTDKRKGKSPQLISLDEAVKKKLIIHKCLAYWMGISQKFVLALGISENSIMFEEKCPEERAHYSSQTFDQLVRVSRWGWVEVSGHSYRGDYDLSRHAKFSGQDLTVFKPFKEPKIVKRKRALFNKAIIGRIFRERTREILTKLQTLPLEYLEERVSNKQPIKIDDIEIPPEAIKIVEVEEKVSGKKFIPHVVEPSFGIERLIYVVLEHSYKEKEGRVVLSLPRSLAPIKVAVFPLNESDKELVKEARRIYDLVKKEFEAIYDESGSIGRRYARVDEIGVPAAVTIDYRTLEDKTVTVRDRDTWKQIRVKEDELIDVLRKFIYCNLSLEEIESRR
jgi:glycyl-tRNA synthetase